MINLYNLYKYKLRAVFEKIKEISKKFHIMVHIYADILMYNCIGRSFTSATCPGTRTVFIYLFIYFPICPFDWVILESENEWKVRKNSIGVGVLDYSRKYNSFLLYIRRMSPFCSAEKFLETIKYFFILTFVKFLIVPSFFR